MTYRHFERFCNGKLKFGGCSIFMPYGIAHQRHIEAALGGD